MLHISRPLEGGIEVPEDPSEIDVATFRKYTAILRSFPENELVFYQLDETISQVHKICVQEQVYERYKQTLPANLREEWEAAVEELIQAGSFDDVEEDYRLQRRHGGGVSHLLQIQQVVECYLMESLHDLIFPRVVASCQEQDRKLQQVMYRMRHYTPEDFGLRKEFQVRGGVGGGWRDVRWLMILCCWVFIVVLKVFCFRGTRYASHCC